MIRHLPVKPTPYYIKYKTYKIGDEEYKIEITYFVYTGNALTNIDKKQTKTILCPKYKLKDTEDKLHNRIVKTYNLLITELRRIGANQISASAVIAQKMR